MKKYAHYVVLMIAGVRQKDKREEFKRIAEVREKRRIIKRGIKCDQNNCWK